MKFSKLWAELNFHLLVVFSRDHQISIWQVVLATGNNNIMTLNAIKPLA